MKRPFWIYDAKTDGPRVDGELAFKELKLRRRLRAKLMPSLLASIDMLPPEDKRDALSLLAHGNLFEKAARAYRP